MHVSSRIALTVLNIVGKAVIVMNFAVLFVYAAEIFPTEVRNGAMGVAQMFTFVGGILAPYIGDPMVRFKYFQIFFFNKLTN